MYVRIIQIWSNSFSNVLSSISWEGQKEARTSPKLEEWSAFEACLSFYWRKETSWIDSTWYSRILRTSDEIYFFIIILHICFVSRLRGKGSDRCGWLKWIRASSIWFLLTLGRSLTILWFGSQEEGFRSSDIFGLWRGIFTCQDLEFDRKYSSKASPSDSLLCFLWFPLSFGHRSQYLFILDYWW